mgnify:CR=1 FL=1
MESLGPGDHHHGKILFAAAMAHVLDSRRRALVVALAALALGLAGTPASAQKPRDAATLRLDFMPTGSTRPFAYGVEKGMYAEQGIDLTILEGNGSGATVQQVGAGTDRFGSPTRPPWRGWCPGACPRR